MTDKNFIRYFVILNPHDSKKGTLNTSGYCKVEAVNSKAVITVSLRDVDTQHSSCRIYAVVKGLNTPTLIGNISSASDGTVYKEFETNPSNIFNSNCSIGAIEAIYITNNDEIILCGYTDRNAPHSSKKAWDECIACSISSAPSDEAPVQSPDVEDPIEELSIAEDDVSTLSDNNSDQPTEDTDGLASYLGTFAQLYRNLVDSASQPASSNDDDSSYIKRTGEYYSNKLNSQESLQPFTFEQHNTKWVKLDHGAYGTLLGCVYESSTPKYIAYATPSIGISIGTPQTGKCTIWLPAKDNPCSILGYWVTFIDCNNGAPTIPDIKIL